MASSQSCVLNESGDINNLALNDFIKRDPFSLESTLISGYTNKNMDLLVFQNSDNVISSGKDDFLNNYRVKTKYKQNLNSDNKNLEKVFGSFDSGSTCTLEECFKRSLNIDDSQQISINNIVPQNNKSPIFNDGWMNSLRYSTDNQFNSSDLIFKSKTSSQGSSDSNIENTYHIWSGNLKHKIPYNPTYSNKVFLGGVPWDITEQTLLMTFRNFGPCRIEWPGKDGKHARHPPKGYVYLLFDNERSVKSLLSQCTGSSENLDDGRIQSFSEYFFPIISRRLKSKEIQVIPWIISDSNYLKNSYSQRLDPSKTVFVGGLHGMITAESLALIMDELFGSVLYAGIDTDKYKYPIGSGRITFESYNSYMKAVQAAYIEIKTSKFSKKIQIDPYLEDSMCSSCNINPGPFFCRDQVCYKYFCRSCWLWHHSVESLQNHKPISRHSKNISTSQHNTNFDSVFSNGRSYIFGQNIF